MYNYNVNSIINTICIGSGLVDWAEWSASHCANLMSGETAFGHIQQEAGCSPQFVLLSTEQRYAFIGITSLCVIFVRHWARQIQNIGYDVGGGYSIVVN
jgi:hypothetical protein